MDIKNILLITGKDMRESFKNRWFVLYTMSFSILAMLILMAASGAVPGSGTTVIAMNDARFNKIRDSLLKLAKETYFRINCMPFPAKSDLKSTLMTAEVRWFLTAR